MAYRELHMMEIKEVLRLWTRGHGLRTVASRTGVDRKTVRRYVDAAQKAGLEPGTITVEDSLVAEVEASIASSPARVALTLTQARKAAIPDADLRLSATLSVGRLVLVRAAQRALHFPKCPSTRPRCNEDAKPLARVEAHTKGEHHDGADPRREDVLSDPAGVVNLYRHFVTLQELYR